MTEQDLRLAYTAATTIIQTIDAVHVRCLRPGGNLPSTTAEITATEEERILSTLHRFDDILSGHLERAC